MITYPEWNTFDQSHITTYDNSIYLIQDNRLYGNWRLIQDNIDTEHVMTHLPEYLMEILL